MSRRGLILFTIMCVVWGIPYLLIKVAVEHLTPAVIVEARTFIGAAVLLPLAWREGSLAALRPAWKPLLVYTIAELAIPWYLLSSAEEHLPSSLTGLLIATVPLITAGLALLFGGFERTSRRGLAGLLLGLSGVGLLLGLDVGSGDLPSVVKVLFVALGYSIGPLVAARFLGHLSSLALAAVSLALVALAYLPLAVQELPSSTPPADAILSLLGLGLICTALAFVVFFELLREIPPTKATLITYFNPVVAVVLGVAVLGESLGAATAAGFALILLGSWMATRPSGRASEVAAQPAASDPQHQGADP
jgi:drug/metabolite transporter (DMT)-like permease